MTESKKLEDVASDLDDMSVTLEEIKEESNVDTIDEKLDKVQTDMDRAADAIEESLDPESPEQ